MIACYTASLARPGNRRHVVVSNISSVKRGEDVEEHGAEEGRAQSRCNSCISQGIRTGSRLRSPTTNDLAA